MRRIHSVLAITLVLFTLAGCDDGTPWSGDEADTAVETRAGFGPSAAYERRLMFLGPGEPLPTAAVFDFTTLADSGEVRQGLRGRLLADGEWTRLMDDGWQLEPMREPWRIVPHGDLTLTVTDAGELGAVLFRGQPQVRLEPNGLMSETSPDASTQLVLRQAALVTPDGSRSGVLLDVQLGRTLAASTAAAAATSTAADSAALATPIAWPGADALLLNASGYYVTLSTSPAGGIAWISQADDDRLHRGVVLQPTAWRDGAEGELQTPTTWRIAAPGGALTGELATEAVDASSLSGLGGLEAVRYVLVGGWVEEDGVRRDVFGLVRHVR